MQGEKTDAQGQNNIFQRKVLLENGVYVVQEEIIIFVVAQQTDIAYAANHTAESGDRDHRKPVHDNTQTIVEGNACQDDEQVTGIKVTVKPERHPHQKQQGAPKDLQMVEKKPPEKC